MPRIVTLCLALIVVSGCSSPVIDQPAGPAPTTLPALELMPESASAAFAIPPIDAVGPKMVGVLRAMASNQDGDFWAGFLAAIEDQLATAEGRQTFADAMASIGFATDAPIGIYTFPAETTDVGVGVAITFTTSDAKKIENWFKAVEILVGGRTAEEVIDNPASAAELSDLPQTRAFTGTPMGYAIRGDRVILASDPRYVAAIEARMSTPRVLDYGTSACPSYSADAFVALVRMDLATNALQPLIAGLVESNDLADLMAGHFPSEAGVFSDDPVLVTFDWAEDRVEFAARADLVEHAQLRKALGRPTAIRLARAVPASTLGVVDFRLNDTSKAVMLELFARTFVNAGTGGIDFPLGDTVGAWLQFVDDEVVLAVTSLDTSKPEGVAMLAVKNRTTLSNLLLTMPAPGETVETYRRVDIRLTPLGFYAATARNTLIIGNKVEEVRETLEYLMDGTTSPAFDAFAPAIDVDAPRYVSLFARSAAVAEVIAAFLNAPAWDLPLLDGADARVEEVRVTGGLTGEWLDTRMSVRFKAND